MAYDFLGLVNDVNERVNEVPLTSANFASAANFYSTAKTAVNSSIRYLNQENFQWPFNHTLKTDTATAGTMRYSFPATAKTIDFNSFRIKRDATIGNVSKRLLRIDYEEYLDRWIDDEYNTSDTGIRDMPVIVTQTPSLEYCVAPAPDAAYKIDYEYYDLPVDLSDYDDAPSAPAAFRHVIVDGAMFYVYLFRGDKESADIIFAKFNEGIKNMRAIYSNRFEYIRDTRVNTSSTGLSHIST